MSKQRISRVWLIRKLCQKHFKAVRPTAMQINNIIKKYKLSRYTEDGKKRSKEAMHKDIAKAYAKRK